MVATPKNLFRGKLKENWSLKSGVSNINAIAFGNGTFAATYGSNYANFVYTNGALDGSTWTQRNNMISGSATWTDIESSWIQARGFMAIASGASYVGFNSNVGGGNWSYLPLPISANWTSIASLYNSTTSLEYWVIVASGTNTALQSSDNGLTWTQVTLPASANWTSVVGCRNTSNNSLTFIAVASGTNQAARSTDGGLTWTAVTMNASANWTSIAWYRQGNTGMAVASGSSSVAYFSGPSATPTNIAALPSAANWTAVAGRWDSTTGTGYFHFCAVASGPSSASASFNGSTWVAANLPTSSNWVSVVAPANASGYAALASNGAVAYSDSGVATPTWTALTTPISTGAGTTAWTSLAALNINNNPTIAAVGTGSVYAYANSSGNSGWTNSMTWATVAMAPAHYWGAIAFGGSSFVALTQAAQWVDANSNTKYVPLKIAATSSDNGVTWTMRQMPAAAFWSTIGYGNGTFVAVAGYPTNTQVVNASGTALAGGSITTNIAATSTDGGVTWTQRTMPANANWNSLAYGNGVWVATSYNSTVAATSTDNGATWTQRALPSANTNYRSVAFGNGVFVAVTAGGFAATSTDGVTWTARTMPVATTWNNVTFGNGTFVASNTGQSYVAVSADGINWSLRSTSGVAPVISGAYGNGQFALVSIGANQLMGLSEDNITVYTVPVGTTTVLTEVLLVNGPSAASLGLKLNGEDLIGYQSVAANATITLNTKQVLNPGDTIVGYASAVASPSVHINGVEVS